MKTLVGGDGIIRHHKVPHPVGLKLFVAKGHPALMQDLCDI